MKISIFKESFYIFKITNFLPKNIYENLRKNFPLHNENTSTFANKKYVFTSGTEEFENILRSNKELKEFYKHITSKRKLYLLYFRLIINFIISRRNNIMDIVKLLRIPRFHFGKFRKNRLFNDISVGIQISYIFNGGKIVPHTDSVSKLLSLLYYFPDNTVANEVDFGTIFYKSDKKNFNNEHLDNERDELEFKANSKILYKTEFNDKNILYGFIKNEKSWHAVDKIITKEDYCRKSININFNLV